MITDARGLPISNASGAVVEAVDRFTIDFLGSRLGAGAMLAFADQHRDCALPQLYAAALHVYAQSTAHLTEAAAPLVARVEPLRTAMNEREHLFADAIAAACGLDYEGAIARCEALVARWPRDVVAAKFAEFMFYMAPDYTRHLRFMESIAAANAGFSHFEAMHAFALGMAGQPERAERVAEAAIAHDPDTPWAHHALAHQYLQQARLADGLAALEGFAPSWEAHVKPMQCHNWWHLALFHLAALQRDAALDDYRARLWGYDAADPQAHVDAISMLWRLELVGAEVHDEWAAIAPHVAARAGEQVFPFLSAHYAYALARAGEADAARAACAAMRAYGDRQQGRAQHAWRVIGVPLVQGCIALAEGDAARSAALLAPIASDLACVGGSDAQNDLFAQTYLVALIRSGRASAARALLRRRVGDRQPMPIEQFWLDAI